MPLPTTTGSDAKTSLMLPVQSRWVPIRSLFARHKSHVSAHLMALPSADRYLRFGFAASDKQIMSYVASLDFGRDQVYGIFNRRLQLLGLGHLAFAGDPTGEAELGMSVAAQARGRGFGKSLFEHACLHARNRGVNRLVIHALSENRAMLHIARKAGALIEHRFGDAEARLLLPQASLASQLGQLIEDSAAELDYRLKRSNLRREKAAVDA